MAVASKALLTAGSIATALLFGGGVYLFMNFGSIAKNVSERVASDTLGVDVDIGGVNVNWQQKSVTVSNVRVGNPPGYQGQHAATIETIYLKAHSFSETLLNFQDVKVAGTEAYLEVKPDATNLTDIKKNVNAKAAAGSQAAQQIKVIIEAMRIESLTVNPNVLLFTDQKMAPIKVPDIVLTGIGTKEKGVLASEAIGQIWAHVAEKVSQAANEAGYYQGVDPDALGDLDVGQIEVLKEQIKQDVDELGDNLKKMFSE